MTYADIIKERKTEANALYAAFDIHRRVLAFAAMCTAFDPFGKFDPFGDVTYHLHDLQDAAWALREDVSNHHSSWRFLEDYKPLRPIKEGKTTHKTFRNHISGIETAIRHFLNNPWTAIKGYSDDPRVDKIRAILSKLRDHMCEKDS